MSVTPITHHQVDNDHNCFAKARENGESTFTLRARDPTAPKTILFWMRENIETAPAEKLRCALEDALACRQWPGRRPAD